MPFPEAAEAPRRPPLRIGVVASECAPFAKTGGLADVSAALARALVRRGHDVRVFLPNYRSLSDAGHVGRPGLSPWTLEFPGGPVTVSTRKLALPDAFNTAGDALEIDLVDAPSMFDREGLYGSDDDEPMRWASFNRAVLEICQREAWSPDVLHVNDWHTGLLPLILRAGYRWDHLLANTRTLLSIHNLGYQGTFGADALDVLGLGSVRDQFHQERLANGQVNFLETGILHADWLSTVSRTYADEIQTEVQGFGLDGLLRQRADHLVGIVNGVDYGEWSPDVDPHIPAHFDPSDLAGKRVCRDALLDEFNLAPNPAGPVLGMVSRFTGQKGFELLPEVLQPLLQQHDVRLCVLGSGDESLEGYFQRLRDSFPDKVGVFFGYKNPLSHRIEAGSDLFLMPSRYEPCGLNQLYSMRYGTIPLVRATGGLSDTVERYDPERQTGTGFVFYDYQSAALAGALGHALEVWEDQKAWSGLRLRGMRVDASWTRRVREYEDLYGLVMAEIGPTGSL